MKFSRLFSLLLLLPFTSLAASAVAQTPDPTIAVPTLQVTITTGGDDLRSGSVAYGVVRLQDGRTLPKVNLNSGKAWANGSTRTVSIPLPAGTLLNDLSRNMASFTLEQDGAPRNTFEGYNNWNVDRVRISTPRSCVSGNRLVNLSGKPIVRFTGGRTFWETPISVPASLAQRSPAALQIGMVTGGDDLRSGSVAYGILRLRDGRTLPKVNLNQGKGWANGSRNTVSMPLSGARLGDIAALTIEHDGAPRRFPDGYDNWNLNGLSVATPSACTEGVSLAEQSGRPLVRLTGERTFWSTPLRSR